MSRFSPLILYIPFDWLNVLTRCQEAQEHPSICHTMTMA